MKIVRTSSENKDFQNLVNQLDSYLKKVDGDQHEFYHQYNKISMLHHCILIYENDIAIACGALKSYNKATAEIKRMFTLPNYRGKGFASYLLIELENWAKELGFEKTILETGRSQKDAVALYVKNNYQIIPNFGQYADIKESICFEKEL